MPQLSAANITIIVELAQPFCDTENNRRTLIDLIFAGASSKPDIDTGGAPLESTNRLVSRLISYGEIESGKPALWALLEAIRPRVGIDKQKQIDDLRSVIFASSVPSVDNAAATDAAGLVSSPNEAGTSYPVFSAKPNTTPRDASGSNSNGASQTSHDGDKTPLWSIPVILGLLLAFMALVAGVVALLPPAQRDPLLYTVGLIPASETPTPSHTPSLTPTVTYSPTFTRTPTPISTPAPTPFPLEGFSVVVAGFASIDADGNLVEDQTADRVSDAVLEALQALGQIQFLVGWTDPFVGHILEQTPEERYQHAVALGETLGADVVIYGIVSSDDYYITLQPSFYFAATWVDQDGDLFAHDVLLPIQFLRSSAGNELGSDFRARLQVISVFLQGLELYLTGNYNGAYTTFLEAGEVANSFVPSIYVYAGNAANRNGDYDNALATFDRVLDTEPDFARALIGRGVTLAQMAQPRLSDTYDPTAQLGDEASCMDAPPDDSRTLALLALRCFQAAIDSPNPSIETQSTLRAYLNMGQVNAWLADLPGGEHSRWADAESYFEQALGIFNAIPEPSRVAFNYFGALAYAGLAQVNNRVRTEPDSAICVEVQAFYQQAVELLLNNADRSAYVQSLIDSYEANLGEIAACVLD